MLRIYNTLTRAKQDFIPIAPPFVKMYVCGVTVYDYCHLGHARFLLVFDLVQRWLRASGYKLTYVRNITDIDDKIIRRAVENGETIGALTERFIRYMNEDAAALGVQKPDLEPRATHYVPQMLSLIGRLQQQGLAYMASDGDVNFSVRAFGGYGKLSGKSLDELRAGERVEVASSKRDPLDFVLWKHAKEGEPAWDSPWGKGRPGWHVECSAMSCALLGEHIDIHGGGQDLQFPHHENEIAQSEGATGSTFVNIWMHNGFVRVDNEKMSKSLGNFSTIRDITKRFDPEVVRFFIVRAHYRSPLNYSDQHLEDARQSLARLYTSVKGIPIETNAPDWEEPHAKRFREAMDDDFNTPEAVAALFDLANEANRSGSAGLRRQLRALGGILGLLERDSEEFLKAMPAGAAEGSISEAEIETLIAARRDARSAKNFARADEIRAELLAKGIVLEDSAKGTTWRRS
ncbi:MAG: cysteine--tRNA ligase [Betaproteobacteria bacterium RIFCSPLOWO2_12_FULL_63_13]|nr:MAG: cysteine--tRNA ligase [Betaproteobacteria bacterium RIFCSPLOWO2_12_FULL_63_13]